MIQLCEINEKSFKTLLAMKLPPEQSCFVAANVYSLAQAWLYGDEARPLAVCNDEEVIGFLMLDWDEGERTVGIWRFMIAPEHQRKGYGRQAIEAAIRLARETGKFDLMHLDYVPGNSAAKALYFSLGFRENGDVEDGEIVMTLPLTDKPKVGMLTADDEDIEDFLDLIADEKQAGTEIPAIFCDEEALKREVENGNVRRFTLMGETIGVSCGGALLVSHEMQAYLPQILTKESYLLHICGRSD